MSARLFGRAALGALLLGICGIGWSQEAEPVGPPETSSNAADEDAWIDRLHRGVHSIVWRSAMGIDRMFGAEFDEQVYRDRARGSITPAVLWDEFGGLDQKFRFHVKLPLPHVDERYNAFIGTFNREEFVTQREQESGALPRQRGQVDEDETLVGIHYRDRDEGGRFEADAGMRVRSPLDPFVKAGYRFERALPADVLLRLRETVFWQNSEEFGLNSRVDLERIVEETWVVRWTASATISERSEGVRGYSSLTAFRGLPNRKGIGAQIFTSGEFDAAVPLGEYGVKLAYRQRVLRDWLVLEIRPSVTWPKTEPGQTRKANLGLGIGFEMFFGRDEFQARPATF